MGKNRCSNCAKMGHNSRTCHAAKRRSTTTTTTSAGGGGGLSMRLFGVQVHVNHQESNSSSSSSSSSYTSVDHQKRSFSLDSSSSTLSSSLTTNSHVELTRTSVGYLSDGLTERAQKKGIPWTEEEHRVFLIGLEKLGKGDWRGISREFVRTRTPTQVASHAQKYFLRQNNLHKRKRRSSLLDAITHRFTAQDEKNSNFKPSDASVSQGFSSKTLISQPKQQENSDFGVRKSSDDHSYHICFDDKVVSKGDNSTGLILGPIVVQAAALDLELKLSTQNLLGQSKSCSNNSSFLSKPVFAT